MTLDLATLLSGHVFSFMLIFTRIGAIFMGMPGIGDAFMPAHQRLQIALLISFILLPLLGPTLPPMPEHVPQLVQLMLFEFATGAFIGLTMRLILGALEVAGMLISVQIGLSNAMIFNPAMATQGSLTGAMMSMLGILFVFESGLLDMIMKGLAQSYVVFVPGAPLPIGDMTEFFTKTVTVSIEVALRMIAPFMVLGIVFQILAGVMVKMVPQMQIFFVAVPLQIIMGMVVFSLTLGSIMLIWANTFERTLAKLFGG